MDAIVGPLTRALVEALAMFWEVFWPLVLGFALSAAVQAVVSHRALAAWVPTSFWRSFFLSGNPTLAAIEGPLVGPLVAIVSFVCSVGNVPLAAVLWRGGISFGGVVSFIFADLIVLPILDIYRKYYGPRVMLYTLATFYVTMAAAGYLVELLFGALGIIPTNRAVSVLESGPTWNYTSFLDLAFLILAAVLVWRFLATGGLAMLRTMNKPEGAAVHGHGLGYSAVAPPPSIVSESIQTLPNHDHGSAGGERQHGA